MMSLHNTCVTLPKSKLSLPKEIRDRGIISASTDPLESFISLFLVTRRVALAAKAKHAAGLLSTTAHTSGNAPASTLEAVHSTLAVSAEWALALEWASLLVLATAFGTVDSLLGEGITNGLCEATLANLSADEIVYTIL